MFQSTNQYMSGGQNYILLAIDMAKVGGPLSVVKVLQFSYFYPYASQPLDKENGAYTMQFLYRFMSDMRKYVAYFHRSCVRAGTGVA